MHANGLVTFGYTTIAGAAGSPVTLALSDGKDLRWEQPSTSWYVVSAVSKPMYGGKRVTLIASSLLGDRILVDDGSGAVEYNDIAH